MRPHLALALAVGALAHAASATTLVRRSDEDLAQSARAIVRGVVLERTTAYRRGPVPVFTDVSVEVLEVLKGQVDDPVLHVALPGGEVDGHAYQVAGTPDLTPGLEVVLFLTRLAGGEWIPLGFAQGSRRLATDPATGAQHVHRMEHDVSFVTPSGAPAQALRAAPPSWASFRRQLKQWAGQP